jgi:hypothetical protein
MCNHNKFRLCELYRRGPLTEQECAHGLANRLCIVSASRDHFKLNCPFARNNHTKKDRKLNLLGSKDTGDFSCLAKEPTNVTGINSDDSCYLFCFSKEPLEIKPVFPFIDFRLGSNQTIVKRLIDSGSKFNLISLQTLAAVGLSTRDISKTFVRLLSEDNKELRKAYLLR